MGKTRIVKYYFTFTALILVALLLAAGLILGTAATGTADAHQAQEEEKLLQFSSGGHVLGFGSNEVYLAGFDHALKVEFAGGNFVTPVAESSGMAENNVPELGRVTYSGTWKEIDVTFRAAPGGIAESIYAIHPGGDPADISLRYNVPVEIRQDGGLCFYFESGYMTETAPVAWQEIDGRHVAVSVQFEQQAENRVGFSLGSYDPAHSVYIDPVYQWHTFHGSVGYDAGYSIAVDSSGNVYVTGYSSATWGAPLNAHTGGNDIVIVKLNSEGAHQWHTFYGAAGSDYGYGIAVDSSGNVYVTGYSYATWNGPDGESPLNAHTGGNDIVIVKLNSEGAHQWHTFYGAAGSDYGYGIAVDSSGNVYVTGYSYATWNGPDGESPLNAHTGGSDMVIVKLNSEGAHQWHTFYGSSNNDFGYGIAVDSSGNVYVTGESHSNWGLPANPYTGGGDIVIVKLNSAGTYQWHTFHGSVGYDAGYSIAVDSSGNVYVTGYSSATWNGPDEESPLNAHAGFSDIVIVKLDSAGAYQWHTFYGSTGDDEYCDSIVLDSAGGVYVAGNSLSAWNGPDGESPLNTYDGGSDIVIVKLDSAGTYQWHTFYGSSNSDYGYGIAVDSSGNIYVTGESYDTWGSSPLNAFTGSNDIVIIKCGDGILPPATPTRVGVHRDNTFYLDADGDLNFDAAIDRYSNFGTPADIPVIGNWNGDGHDQIGIRRDNTFYLDYNDNMAWEYPGDIFGNFGVATDAILIGDWNGDGKDQVGVWRDGTFYLDYDGNLDFDPAVDKMYSFGASDGTPIIGDWNGDGKDQIGVRHGSIFYLDYDGDGAWNPAVDKMGSFGLATDEILIGDWNGDGSEQIGVHRDNTFYLDYDGDLNFNAATDKFANFGTPDDIPVIGDWNGNGADQIGIRRGPTYYLDLNGNMAWEYPGDIFGNFGIATDKILLGKWKGE
jgi:uncharacterized delta-60 repeat protein